MFVFALSHGFSYLHYGSDFTLQWVWWIPFMRFESLRSQAPLRPSTWASSWGACLLLLVGPLPSVVSHPSLFLIRFLKPFVGCQACRYRLYWPLCPPKLAFLVNGVESCCQWGISLYSLPFSFIICLHIDLVLVGFLNMQWWGFFYFIKWVTFLCPNLVVWFMNNFQMGSNFFWCWLIKYGLVGVRCGN